MVLSFLLIFEVTGVVLIRDAVVVGLAKSAVNMPRPLPGASVQIDSTRELIGHRASAEDVFQEVWGKIIKSREKYRPTAKFTTFLYRVAHNCFIDHIRRNKRHANSVDIEPENHRDPGEQPEMLVEKGLARERLDSALLDLPDEQRDVFLLREEADLSLEQIAAITGTNRETAKSRLRYAVNKLRVAIDEPAETS